VYKVYKAARNKGFTLLEVMLVVLIIGIVTSLAVYSMSPAGPSRQAKSEAQGLMAVIDYAQQQAILSHQPYGLVIQDHSYQVFVYARAVNNPQQGQWQGQASLQHTQSLLRVIQPQAHLNGTPNIVLLPSKEPQVYIIEVALEGYSWHLSSVPPQPLTLMANAHE